MPKRLTTTPPLYVKKHKHEWSKRIILYLFTFFLLLNIFGYLFYYDDMSGPFIDPSSIFIKQCDMRSKSKDHLTPVDMEFNITTPYDDDDDDVDFEDDDIIDSINIANEIDEKHDERINRKYCGKSSCKFLFAYYQPEQETKANMHFRSFVNLAQALDRVMVLTNVGNSRINSCQNFTFGFYYNEKALQSMFPKVKFISQKDFQNWMRERNQKPNTEHAYILPGKEEISTMELVKPYPDILRTKHCLDRFDFKLDDKTNFKLFNTPIEFSKDLEKYQGFADFLVNNLRTDADVLLTSHFVFHSLFPNVSSPVPYSNHYHEEAAKITNRIKPYVAIHWRMERADINKLPECADALVKKIQQLKDSNNIQNVYLATDYPTGGGNKTQSQTFHLLTENHHEAIRLLNSTFNIHTWVSSKIFSNLRNDETFEKEFLGAGMPGIVDKLVCIEADYFLATPEGCGRARSTYTTMIINERDKALKLGDKPQLKNVVERWIEPIENGKFTF